MPIRDGKIRLPGQIVLSLPLHPRINWDTLRYIRLPWHPTGQALWNR